MPALRNLPVGEGTLVCKGCGIEKPIKAGYYFQYRTNPVPRKHCIECVRAKRRKFYRDNPEKEAYWDSRLRPTDNFTNLVSELNATEKQNQWIEEDDSKQVKLKHPANRNWTKLKPPHHQAEQRIPDVDGWVTF